MLNLDRLREEMVRKQLLARGIKDRRVLDVFKRIPRHNFVSESLKEFAYDDCPLQIGQGQTISQPYMAALMSEYLVLKGNEKVLEIGTGSGYQTAILSELASEVYSIERIEALAKKAIETLKLLGYKNINIKVGDGSLGWPEKAPFDRIIIAAAAPKIPDPLIAQLALCGRLVAPIGDRFNQILSILEKDKEGTIRTQEAGGCVFVPLVGKYGFSN